METKDLTIENLQALIDISVHYNDFTPGYLTWEKVSEKDPTDTFIKIIWYLNFELAHIQEFKEEALEIIFKKDLSEMPLYINDSNDYGDILKSGGSFCYYIWLPVVAIWRLSIGC